MSHFLKLMISSYCPGSTIPFFGLTVMDVSCDHIVNGKWMMSCFSNIQPRIENKGKLV